MGYVHRIYSEHWNPQWHPGDAERLRNNTKGVCPTNARLQLLLGNRLLRELADYRERVSFLAAGRHDDHKNRHAEQD